MVSRCFHEDDGVEAGTNSADELYLNPCVLQPLAIFGSDCDGSLDGFAIHV